MNSFVVVLCRKTARLQRTKGYFPSSFPVPELSSSTTHDSGIGTLLRNEIAPIASELVGIIAFVIKLSRDISSPVMATTKLDMGVSRQYQE